MGNKTGIQWTNSSWNPIRGCSRVSAGCTRCYAETMAARFSDEGQPYYQLAKRTPSGPRWTGEVRVIPEHLADPIRWKRPRKIFVNSMSDLFHEKLTNEEIAAIFGIMAAAPQHTFQVLTKRAKRMREWFEWATTADDGTAMSVEDIMISLDEAACNALAGHFDCCHLGLVNPKMQWPLPNVWIGTSVENQEAADERIPDLIRCPAAIRFLSCEPLIDQVTLQGEDPPPAMHSRNYLRGIAGDQRIHWIIAGCESGPGMRPCNHRWLRLLREQCKATGTKFFLKQATAAQEGGHRLYPSGQAARSDVVDVVKAGPGSTNKLGGVIGLPYLDGKQYTEFPA